MSHEVNLNIVCSNDEARDFYDALGCFVKLHCGGLEYSLSIGEEKAMLHKRIMDWAVTSTEGPPKWIDELEN